MEALAALELPSLRHFEATATKQAAWLEHLAAAPWLSQLDTLDIDRFSRARGSLWVEMPHLQRLTLWGTKVWPDAETAESLAALALPALHMLSAGVLDAHDARALSGAAWWPRLEWLVVTLDAEDDGGLAAVQALVGRPLPWLYTLKIYSTPLCAEALRLLAAFELPCLEEFALGLKCVLLEEENEALGAARTILEAAPWRRQCGEYFKIGPDRG
jgi:hypothetical protein